MFDVRCLIFDVKLFTSSIRHQTSNIFSVAVLIGTFGATAVADETTFDLAIRLYQQAQWQQAATAFAEAVPADSQDSEHNDCDCASVVFAFE